MNIIRKILYLSIFIISTAILSGCYSTTTTYKQQDQKVIEIAVMMPLTGQNATLGKQYSDLIKMGIIDGTSIEHLYITIYDAANEMQALASLKKIVDKRTNIILGPLNSPITKLIAEEAAKHNIIVITMSNNPALADTKLLVFGHAPLKQLEKITLYLLNHGSKNFITLLPTGQHAQNMSKIIQNMAIQHNTTLVRTEFYTDTPESINRAVKIVSDSVDNLNEIDDTKPIIYISDDNHNNLHMLFSALNKYNLDKKATIVGDNRIDTDSPYNIDITFTGSLHILNTDVNERAKVLGIHHLSFMHLMAYDLGRMTVTYIGDTFDSSLFLNRLHSTQPYIGLSGNISFIDGIAQREYYVVRRINGTYSTLQK